MLDYMFMPFRRYADFQGRSRRMEFWAFALFNFIVYTVLAIVGVSMGLSFSAFTNMENGGVPSAMFGGGLMFVFAIGGIYMLATLVPNIAVAVRRFHDRDMSGWWYLGFIVLSLIPLVGWIASIVQLVLFFLPGTPGHNRFGPDPKDPAGAEVFA